MLITRPKKMIRLTKNYEIKVKFGENDIDYSNLYIDENSNFYVEFGGRFTSNGIIDNFVNLNSVNLNSNGILIEKEDIEKIKIAEFKHSKITTIN